MLLNFDEPANCKFVHVLSTVYLGQKCPNILCKKVGEPKMCSGVNTLKRNGVR